MTVALIIGRGGSTGLPGKNVMKLMGRPLMTYPILAAKNSKHIKEIYLSTDCEDMKEIGRAHEVTIIDRPDFLATKEALAEDAFIHGYKEIVKLRGGEEPDLVTLLFCNGATVLPKYIDEACEKLRSDDTLDSVATASEYNMWSPLRAKKISEDGLLEPFIEPSYFGDNVTCDRGSQGSSWYADCSMFTVRPYCFEKKNGFPPFTWLGKKVFPIKQWGGLDIDYHWQVPIVQHWLEQHGFTEDKLPY
jgi:CMP-N-acetylneuraminic acid synthetase